MHNQKILTVPRASHPIFMYCTPEIIFGGTEGVGSRFHVLSSRTHFRWYRGCRVPFSSFARPNSFSSVPRASGPLFMFCALGHIFDSTEGVGSRFHILCSRTRFCWYRGHQLPFSCFTRPDLFSALPRASDSVFMFCAPRLISGGTEGVGSRFHVLCVRTYCRRYRGRPIPFSYFSLPNMFLTVRRASGLVFMFCVPRHVFGDAEGVGSRFNLLCSRTRFS
jgi:hypothetical protein